MIKLLCFAGWTHTLEAKWVDEDYFVHDSFVSLGHFFMTERRWKMVNLIICVLTFSFKCKEVKIPWILNYQSDGKKKTSLKIDFSLYDWNQKACSSPSLSVAANNFTEKGWFLDNLTGLLPYTFTFSVVWNSA